MSFVMNNIQEEWKSIPFEPDLEASSLGRVRVISHEKPMPHGGVRTYGGTPTKGQWAKDRKRYIYPRKNHKTLKVAPLVCEAFHGKASNGMVCIHIDEDSSNNKPANLKWGTQKENLNCPKFLEYCKSRVGNKNPYRKGRSRVQ